MNFCTKCGSLYTKPGTCNCYAGRESAGITNPEPLDPESVARIKKICQPPGDRTSGTITTPEHLGDVTVYYRGGDRVVDAMGNIIQGTYTA